MKDLVCLHIQGKRFLLVLHLDGVLQLWDLLSFSRLLSYTMNASTLEGKSSYPFFAISIFVNGISQSMNSLSEQRTF